MTNKKQNMKFNRYTFLLFAVIVFLCVYAISMMNTLANQISDYWTILSPLIIVLLTFIVLVTTKVKYTQFARFWFFWIIWIFFEVLAGKTGSEKGNLFRMMLAPTAFLFFYVVSLKCTNSLKKIIFGFIVLFLVTFYWSITKSLEGISNLNLVQTNYVFWPVCCAPVIFLITNKQFKRLLIGCMLIGIVISQKRSVVIIAILVFVFVFLTGRRSFKQSMSVIILLAIGYFFFNYYFTDNLLTIQSRMEMMSSDEGSGRLPIYEIVWKSITNLNYGDIIIGKGFGTITQIGFTNAHNDFLQILYEYGIIGVLLYFLLIYHILKQLQMTKKHLENGQSVVLAEGTSFIIFIVLGLVSNLVVSYTFFVFLCCFWGFIEGRYITVNQKEIA